MCHYAADAMGWIVAFYRWMKDEEARRRVAAASSGPASNRERRRPPARRTDGLRFGEREIYSAVDAKPQRSTSLHRLANITANPRALPSSPTTTRTTGALWWVRADGEGRVFDADEPEGRDAIARLVAR